MVITIYGIKSCDNVKKALKFFKEALIDLTFVDFKQTKPTQSQLRKWAKYEDITKLFNTKSRTYRELKLSNLLSFDEKIEYMSKEPLLIKRPIVEYDNKLIIGFDKSDYQKIFQK